MSEIKVCKNCGCSVPADKLHPSGVHYNMPACIDALKKQLAKAENEIVRLNKSLKEWALWKDTI